jgi:hypothetical protein
MFIKETIGSKAIYVKENDYLISVCFVARAPQATAVYDTLTGDGIVDVGGF